MIKFAKNYFSMVSIETISQVALSFPETDEHPHFERFAFRVKKKIFATLSFYRKKARVVNFGFVHDVKTWLPNFAWLHTGYSLLTLA